MTEKVIISTVPRRKHRFAGIFLAVGSATGSQRDIASQAFDKFAHATPAKSLRFYWARRGSACVAVSLVVKSAGRCCLAFFSPPTALGVQPGPLAETLALASKNALDDSTVLVQSLVSPDDHLSLAVLNEAGFIEMAELVYMFAPLSDIASFSARRPLRWQTIDDLSPGVLEEVITATYAGSLDCPMISKLRNIDDVIESHQASGQFDHQSWWVVYDGALPVGCVLLNMTDRKQIVEVVYLGVVEKSRGQNLGKVLLSGALARLRAGGCTGVRLAVDSNNSYAVNIYRDCGFLETTRRKACIMTKTTVLGH